MKKLSMALVLISMVSFNGFADVVVKPNIDKQIMYNDLITVDSSIDVALETNGTIKVGVGQEQVFNTTTQSVIIDNKYWTIELITPKKEMSFEIKSFPKHESASGESYEGFVQYLVKF